MPAAWVPLIHLKAYLFANILDYKTPKDHKTFDHNIFFIKYQKIIKLLLPFTTYSNRAAFSTDLKI